MGYRFEAQEWQTITAAEKVSRCLLMAEETQALADDATPELAQSYIANVRFVVADSMGRGNTF